MALIDRDALIIKLQNSYCLPRFIKNYNEADKTYSRILDDIANAEVIDAKPVVHGEWEGWECAACGKPWNYLMKQNGDDWGYFDPMPPYCPNCGADMRGEQHG